MSRASAVCGLAMLLGVVPSAKATRIDYLGEVRTSAFVGVANVGQFGTRDDTGPCGVDPLWDIGSEATMQPSRAITR